MLNTSKDSLYSTWVNQQKAFIASLQLQPLVVVLRPSPEDYETPLTSKPLFSLIEQLHNEGVRHIEIGWTSDPRWISLVTQLNTCFPDISLGAASINNLIALKVVAKLGLNYAMTPTWNPELQLEAIRLKQLLIPGVLSSTEIQEAKSFGFQLIKLFPASMAGIKYIHQIQIPLGSLPFVIAAGGLTVSDLTPWLEEGYGAIALGRKLIQNNQITPQLQGWLQN